MSNNEAYFFLRSGLHNCQAKFTLKKSGRIAFLGGSITQSSGWRDGVMRFLCKKFPQTTFDFIGAGIGSLGSVPHAFRLEQDVLSKGEIDLLFLEAAVNDAVNIPSDPLRMLRGMEGVVRHVRMASPMTDIVQMHFAMPEHLADYDAGRIPLAISVHERVAEFYGNPSLNLAKEVNDRIGAGEFTWEGDFKDLHPSPFGHDVYATTINRMLDTAWSELLVEPKPHSLPGQPLDTSSYFQGFFDRLENVEIAHDFELVPRWLPTITAKTRPGFVDVPALVARGPGASMRMQFHGTAAGLLIASGPKTGILEVSCDGEPFRRIDTFTSWSNDLYLPWAIILADGLDDGPHSIRIRLGEECNPKDATLVICRLLVNGQRLTFESVSRADK
jgi:sialidase-1